MRAGLGWLRVVRVVNHLDFAVRSKPTLEVMRQDSVESIASKC